MRRVNLHCARPWLERKIRGSSHPRSIGPQSPIRGILPGRHFALLLRVQRCLSCPGSGFLLRRADPFEFACYRALYRDHRDELRRRGRGLLHRVYGHCPSFLLGRLLKHSDRVRRSRRCLRPRSAGMVPRFEQQAQRRARFGPSSSRRKEQFLPAPGQATRGGPRRRRSRVVYREELLRCAAAGASRRLGARRGGESAVLARADRR